MNDKHQHDPQEERLDRLIASARRATVDTARAELGFETRLMARLRAERGAATPWFNWTWRLAPVFALIVIILAVAEWTTPSVTTAEWEMAFTYDIQEPSLVSFESLD